MPYRPALVPAVDRTTLMGSPFTALLAAVGGGLLLSARPRDGHPAKPIATLTALALLGIAAHRPVADALRAAASKRRSGELRLSFVVHRPVEEVFRFCADFENFPRWISALREVRDTGDGRSHWCATTRGGREVEWDAVTTKFVTNSVIGWRSVPGAPVTTKGVLRFSPEDEATCVRVAVDYSVTRSGLTDALAALIKPRRKRDLDTEVRRLEREITAENG